MNRSDGSWLDRWLREWTAGSDSRRGLLRVLTAGGAIAALGGFDADGSDAKKKCKKGKHKCPKNYPVRCCKDGKECCLSRIGCCTPV
jgi:hypothetical protein